MKIGDNVSVLDSDLNGVVTSVHGETVIIKDKFGFTHRYLQNKLIIRDEGLYHHLKVEKEEPPQKKLSKKKQNKHFVLDLHFDQLVKDPSNYDSFERLLLQKEKLINTLEFCKKNKIKKLEIIHGIGDGVVQKMVMEVLRNQINLEFEDHEFFYHSSGSVQVIFQ